MGTVSVREIRIDNAGRFLVIPDLPAGRDFAFIYRAARGARWDPELHALYFEPGSASPFEQFQHISAAAADEYGQLLSVSARTVFSNAPDELEAQIRAWQPPRSLTGR